MKPGDLVVITDTEDFDPRVRGKIGIVVKQIEKFDKMVAVLVGGKIYGFYPKHLQLVEPPSGSVGSNEL